MALGVVVTYFNFTRYKQRSDVFLRCITGLLRTVLAKDILIVECVLPPEVNNQGPEVPTLLGPTIRGCQYYQCTGDFLFQKERLMQIGFEILLDQGYDSLMYVDADIVFDNIDWYRRTQKALEFHNVVQCYSHCLHQFTDKALSLDSFVKENTDGKKQSFCSPGGSWAYHSSVIKQAGIMTYCILGSGDVPNACGYTSPAMLDVLGVQHLFSPQLKAMVRRWCAQLPVIQLYYVDNTITLEAHGSFAARKYRERHKLYSHYAPKADLSNEPGQGFRWTGNNIPLQMGIEQYMKDKDD